MEIKTVSIVGLGALGVLFGHHLSVRLPREALRIIADQERIERYRRDQVYCNGERCRFYYMTPEELCSPADLVLIAVKYNDLDAAVEAVKNQVGPDTIILSLLKGSAASRSSGGRIGMEKVLYCVAQGMDAVKVGNRLTYHHMGMLVSGGRVAACFRKKRRRSRAFSRRRGFLMRRWPTCAKGCGANYAECGRQPNRRRFFYAITAACRSKGRKETLWFRRCRR